MSLPQQSYVITERLVDARKLQMPERRSARVMPSALVADLRGWDK